MRLALVVLALSLALSLAAGCTASERPTSDECVPTEEHCGPIAADTDPCADSAPWPLELRATSLPIAVHYSRRDQGEMAAETLALLETAWRVEVGELGFSPPVPDGGACGDDEAFDVFLWEGAEGSYVEAISDNPSTAHDDWITFMVLDPWGPYGGERLRSTVAHELNHALQGSDDWWESPLAFEMTATFMEEVVFPDDDAWIFTLEDFQARPEWSIDRSDDWQTWYMYGAALYLQFLRDRYFDGDAAFVAEMWRRSRSAPDALEPDFEDALADILAAEGTTFADSVTEFARWRWFTGSRDDGRHFVGGARFPAEASVALAARIDARSGTHPLAVSPMAFGSVYVEVKREAGQPEAPMVSLASADPRVRWVVDAVPGRQGADGERLDLGAGPQPLDLTEHSTRTLVLTAVPIGEHDPDERTDETFAATLRLE